MKGQFNIIKRAYLWLIGGLILVGGARLIFVMNVKFSSEFTGGVQLTLSHNVDQSKLSSDLEWFLEDQGFSDTKVEVDNDGEYANITLKTNVENDEKVNLLSDQLKTFLLEDKYIETTDDVLNLSITGPSVGSYMQRATLWALIWGLVLMAIYMLFSFATIRKYISPSILAAVTIVTMIFDISIPTGVYGLWMMINPTIQVNTIFIIAILTTMGYSINDTIIIFDRIRENLQEHADRVGGKVVYHKIFEKSLWQTMRRSMGTSISTLLVIIAMYMLGTGVIQQFAFTMGVGVLAGTYSSIFIAAPLAYILLGKKNK